MIDHTPHISPHFVDIMRLGNIMFSVATAYAHALRENISCHVPWSFNAASASLHSYLKNGPVQLPSTVSDANEPVSYREPCFAYRKIPSEVRSGGLHGYFQSSLYFADQKAAIRELFAPFIAEKEPGTLGVHIRLGDYKHLQHKFHISDNDFLARACAHVSPEVNRLVLFSDEPQTAQKILSEVPGFDRFFIEVDHCSPCDAIRRMTAMQELIISCSSFSWWGAWLGETERVMAPDRWFVSEISDYHDIYEPHWIKL